eukprot:SAG31_NODE_19323_length_606_cov_0.755424_1_plen_99_part_10
MKRDMGPLEGDGPARAAAAAAAADGKYSARRPRPGPSPGSGFTRSGRARAVTHKLKIPRAPKSSVSGQSGVGSAARLDFADVLVSAAERREAARKARAA